MKKTFAEREFLAEKKAVARKEAKNLAEKKAHVKNVKERFVTALLLVVTVTMLVCIAGQMYFPHVSIKFSTSAVNGNDSPCGDSDLHMDPPPVEPGLYDPMDFEDITSEH